MLTRIILLFIMLLLPIHAIASNWQFVDLGSPDSINYIDVDSLRVEKDLIYYWKKRLIVSEEDPLRTRYGAKAYLIKTYGVEDCRNAIYKPLYSDIIDGNGTVVDSFAETDKASPVGPWSQALELHQFICSR